MLTILAYRGSGIPVYAEAELGNETDGAKHTQSVFVEALCRIPDRAHQLVLYVLLTIVWVNKMSFTIFKSDSVDGKIPASKAFKQGSAKLNFVRSALV